MDTGKIVIKQYEGEAAIQMVEGASILQTALDNNIKLIHSCKKGECGSCRAFLLEGEVDMKENYSLFEEELQQGQILLCQSYPQTNLVIVDPIRKLKRE